jgi:adenosylcobinamide kinase/adenosylcobinamide-phosphate guanylyltransferase
VSASARPENGSASTTAALSHLVLGGARSGKSRHAVELARARGGRVAFVATAEAGDADMAARIARHRAERPAAWTTLEAPRALVETCAAAARAADLVIVDCVTVWVANLLLGGAGEEAIRAEAEALARLVAAARPPLLLVSNEVGAGVHPPTAQGMRFRDVLGGVNQRLAAAAPLVTLMVAGIPLAVKRPAGAPVDHVPVPAP